MRSPSGQPKGVRRRGLRALWRTGVPGLAAFGPVCVEAAPVRRSSHPRSRAALSRQCRRVFARGSSRRGQRTPELLFAREVCVPACQQRSCTRSAVHVGRDVMRGRGDSTRGGGPLDWPASRRYNGGSARAHIFSASRLLIPSARSTRAVIRSVNGSASAGGVGVEHLEQAEQGPAGSHHSQPGVLDVEATRGDRGFDVLERTRGEALVADEDAHARVEEYAHHLRKLPLDSPGHAEADREDFGRVFVASDQLIAHGGVRLQHICDCGLEERLLDFEVVVEAAEPDIGGVGELLDAYDRPSFGQELAGSAEKGGTGSLLAAIDARRHRERLDLDGTIQFEAKLTGIVRPAPWRPARSRRTGRSWHRSSTHRTTSTCSTCGWTWRSTVPTTPSSTWTRSACRSVRTTPTATRSSRQRRGSAPNAKPRRSCNPATARTRKIINPRVLNRRLHAQARGLLRP